MRPLTALEPGMTGRYRITTVGSTHEWDLDQMLAKRIPGSSRSGFDHDGVVVKITLVENWPQVGDVAFFWFDDPKFPALMEQWRQTSTIQRIEKIEDPTPWDAPLSEAEQRDQMFGDHQG